MDKPVDKPMEVSAAYIVITRGHNPPPPTLPILKDTQWYFCIVSPSHRIHRLTLIDDAADGTLPRLWIKQYREHYQSVLFPKPEDVVGAIPVLRKDYNVSVVDLISVISTVRIPRGDDLDWVPKRYVSDLAQRMLEVKGTQPPGPEVWFRNLMLYLRENVPLQPFEMDED